MSGARIKTKRSPMKALPITIITSLHRHLSPEHASGPTVYKGKVLNQTENCIRRTASLDALTVINNYSNTNSMNSCLFWQLDKATQTEESCFSDRSPLLITDSLDAESPSEKMEEIIKHRMQRHNFHHTTCEHSVSSQTLSPVHVKASPVLIPQRTNQPIHLRPMRSSVEGLNQEIEKLVLHPSAGPMHSCRQELEMFSRGTPEGHRAPITDLFHPVGEHTRSTQTPLLSSDSQSTSPSEEGGIQSKDASPRINRFLAREPPDGCEKVNLNMKQTESTATEHSFKPVGFQLRPSLGSSFKPIPIIPKISGPSIACKETEDDHQLLEIELETKVQGNDAQ